MKKFILIVLFISTVSGFSQSGWVNLNSGTNSDLYSIWFLDNNTGYIAQDSAVLKTTNGGQNWVTYQIPNTEHSYRFNAIFFLNVNTGFVGCWRDNLRPGLMYKTTDGGLNWVRVYRSQVSGVQTIWFVNQNTGFASDEWILKTTNGGDNWFTVFQSFSYSAATKFVNQNTGFFLRGNGIINTTNCGDNWSEQFIPSVNLDGGFIQNSNLIFGFGGYNNTGIILKTTDEGSSWSTQYFANYILFSGYFINLNTGFAVGRRGDYTLGRLILKTTNSGINWNQTYSDTTGNGFCNIFFTDANTGFIAGFNGTILKTTTGGEPIGVQPISTEVPQSFVLHQNYPNPFNPATKIKFEIPASLSLGEGQRVRLVVYDITGREVETLINEQLQPGVYETMWDASNFASGVYFYKLETNDLVVSKKMVLLK